MVIAGVNEKMIDGLFVHEESQRFIEDGLQRLRDEIWSGREVAKCG